MKTFKTILTLLIFAISIISCSSDDDNTTPVTPVTYNEENPLDAYLAGSGFNKYAVDYKDYGIWEFGFSFKPTVIGKINSIIVKIPDVNTALQVTLWDVATKTVIKSEVINVPTANLTVEKAIVPIVLIKDKEYLISVNSDDFILRTKTDAPLDRTKINESMKVHYPIVAGNITITGYAISTAAETLFPTSNINYFYAGDVSFKFQQTE
jgi:hypothetical protein